jgi:hypothetical protein
MKLWLITAVVSLLWVGLDLCVFFSHRDAHNDAFDEALGRVAGFGLFTIWGIAILWWKSKKERNRPTHAAKHDEGSKH